MDERDEQMQDEELERYGVWVKAGPEEVFEADDDYSLTDLPQDDSVESGGDATSSPAAEEMPGDLDDLEDLDLSDFDDDSEVPSMPSLPDVGDSFEASDDEDDSAPADFSEPVIEDLEFDEIELDEDEESDELVTIDDLDLEEPDDEVDPLANTAQTDDAVSVTVDTEPEHDLTPDSLDLDIDDVPVTNHITADEADFLEDESDIESELQDSTRNAIPAQMDMQEREAFDRIQSELLDIKRELAELRAALRGGATATAASTQQEEVQDEESSFDFHIPDADESGDDEGATGFFDDDEDETIALTGDELDNILNTAEFTEAEGEAAEIDDDFVLHENASNDGDDSGDATESSSAVDEISLDPVEREPIIIEGDESAVDELADMDIDSELAGIDSLEDSTEDESQDEIGEIDIDLDAMDDVNFGEDATASEIDEDEITLDETPGTETEVDELSLDSDELALDDEELELDDEELALPEQDVTPVSAEIEPDAEIAAEDDEEEETVEGFGEFAATVADDIAGDHSDDVDEIDLDADFDIEDPAEPLTEPGADISTDDDEIEIELPDDVDADGGAIESVEGEDDDDLDLGDLNDEIEVDEDDDEDDEPHADGIAGLSDDLKAEIRSVLSYMDQLLEALPDDKIEEFAQSEHFEVYKRLFEELGLET